MKWQRKTKITKDTLETMLAEYGERWGEPFDSIHSITIPVKCVGHYNSIRDAKTNALKAALFDELCSTLWKHACIGEKAVLDVLDKAQRVKDVCDEN